MAKRDLPERTVRLVSSEGGSGCDFPDGWLGGREASLREPNEPLWEGECLQSLIPSLLRAEHKGNCIMLRKGVM